MLMDLLESPAGYYDHIRRYTTSLTTQMDYGFRLKTMEDPRAKKMFKGFLKFNSLAGSQIALLLDLFPILRHLPDVFLPIRRQARKVGREEHELFMDEYLNVKKKMSEGKAIGFTDKLGAYVCGSFLQAGSETTSAELLGFVQAMMIFPEVSRIAHLELDRVCGDQFRKMLLLYGTCGPFTMIRIGTLTRGGSILVDGGTITYHRLRRLLKRM
ncbi:hypothetical protein SLS62_007795 [Diatrype stigma]|uniref:Cytochrome P450 n=1 Tax=Diatrype stigma TaxID=117547 RepID=A0AAN9UYQ5_9PEZI